MGSHAARFTFFTLLCLAIFQPACGGDDISLPPVEEAGKTEEEDDNSPLISALTEDEVTELCTALDTQVDDTLSFDLCVALGLKTGRFGCNIEAIEANCANDGVTVESTCSNGNDWLSSCDATVNELKTCELNESALIRERLRSITCEPDSSMQNVFAIEEAFEVEDVEGCTQLVESCPSRREE
ncbi:MAG: hypothetical protein KTR25_20710 [Myxococcales bacterium]|nr:hypothetical protein [Myxococcales bacterium]